MSREPAESTNLISGAVHGDVVQAQVIEGGVHFHHSARPQVALPYRAGTFPPRAAAFQVRAINEAMAETLRSGQAAVVTAATTGHTSVLSGLGGVGKTQVALDYAEQVWASGEVELAVWVTAGSREAIVSSYARLAADLSGVESPDPEHGARRLVEWLASTTVRWLVVLDDVQSPADLRGLWPPVMPTGRVVVTTRRRDAALRGPGRRFVEVGVFTPDEADAYLRAALSGEPHLLDGAAELAAALGYLPLALAQAGAYLVDRELSCAAYCERLADRRLATLLPEPDGLPDEHRATVTATWSLSVEQANRLAPVGVAGPLLEMASLLDANGIPAEVFTARATVHLLTGSVGRAIGVEEARDGLGCLRRLSLITVQSDAPVRVHGVVQRVTRDSMTQARVAVVARAAADALLDVWPKVERDTALAQMLRANTEALAETGRPYLWGPTCHAVLFRAGDSLGVNGMLAAARDHFHGLHTAVAHHLGADHPATLAARGYLAHWQGRAGDPAAAAAAAGDLLADQVRVLGADHPDTLATSRNHARWLGEAGDTAGAAAAFAELLADHIRVLGADHVGTLTARGYAAKLRGDTGDMAGAVAAFAELLADRSRVLGPDHPDTLTTRGYLAYWRRRAGDLAGALAMSVQLLPDRLRVLGPDHPNTLTTRHELAQLRGEAGDPAGAVAALTDVLADRLRVLGPDHPDTLATRSGIDYWTRQSG